MDELMAVKATIAMKEIDNCPTYILNPDIEIVSYVVKIPSDNPNERWLIKTSENVDFLTARESAFRTAIAARDKTNNYKGIQIILKYTETNSDGKSRKKNYKILTGWRMGTKKILQSLAHESSLLLAANQAFPKIECNSDEEEYLCVNQLFNTLYYFTF